MPCSIGDDVAHAAKILRDGGLVAFATETVYGLGVNAFDVTAIAHLFEVKQRPHFDPIIAHVAEFAQVDELVDSVPTQAQQLAERFWPGPLTLVLPKTTAVPDLLTSGLPNVAVRIPEHPLAEELLRAAAIPVGAPSANLFGRVSPTSAAHVAEQLGDRIDYILDGGPCRIGLESTVIQFTDGSPLLLRPGGLPVEEIESAIGPVRVPDQPIASKNRAQPSPGMLQKHYAPGTRVRLVDRIDSLPDDRRIGLLTLKPVDDSVRFAAVEVLSESGDLPEAAANFFAALRRLDAAGLDLIVAKLFPEQGLGRALNDRIRRAAAG